MVPRVCYNNSNCARVAQPPCRRKEAMPEGDASRAYTDSDFVTYVVTDVLNFGGFFGGETVTLDAAPMAAPDKITGFIIPEHVFENLTVRHLITAGMALGLVVDNGEIRAARVLG